MLAAVKTSVCVNVAEIPFPGADLGYSNTLPPPWGSLGWRGGGLCI